MGEILGDGHEEKMAAMREHSDFDVFAQPANAAFDAGWDAAKAKAAAALTTAQAEIEALRKALASVRAWAASLTVCDMNEIVADNGITAGMVVGQEANEQVRRIDRALSGSKP